MPSRIRPPQERKIDLPTDEDWILVKQHLTWGEVRDSEVRLFKTLTPGHAELDPAQVGVTLAIAYLLDWSLLDAAGNPIVIRRQSPEVLASALRSLDGDKGAEIMEAITAHHTAMQAAHEAEKKGPAGATASPAISASVA
jgi:hypothetical protein